MPFDETFKTAADKLLADLTGGDDLKTVVPGLVVTVTDANGDVYTGAAGVRKLGDTETITPDSTFCFFSTTKAITAVCALQLVEEGLLDLDKPAAEYLPLIGTVKVFDKWDEAGKPVLREPKTAITPRMLLSHTAGFSYEFQEPQVYSRLHKEHGYPGIDSGLMTYITGYPLLFDPGSEWHYGINMDWMGLIIEAIRGMSLDAVMKKYVFAPLGMNSTSFQMTPEMKARLVTVHRRSPETGLLSADPSYVLKQGDALETHNGGHGLYGTVGDYSKFIRMFLNDGLADSGARVLKKETIDKAWEDQVEGIPMPDITPLDPNMSIPTPSDGSRNGWAISFMKLLKPAPSGRPAGSVNWSGLTNLFYFIDRENKLGVFYGAQVLPFGDPSTYFGFGELEALVYKHL
ncbi:serine hydrolase [Dipodascopsis tothii]|uniref:serine hydrolase n=1 Tax=Dipodascopsis tothii TaxID=44089 RepID=UPI0034CE5DB1